MSQPALLAGATNFRAVKPYRAADGRRLRENTVFRSGELSRLDDRDVQTLRALNLRLVCDLRSSGEQEKYPSRWPADAAPLHLDLPARDTANANPGRVFDAILGSPGDAGGRQAMLDFYRGTPGKFAGHLQILFDTLTAQNALPVLIHCHAGKDRTGFITAMLLSAIGISRADVLEDYELTAIYFPVEAEAQAIADWARKDFGHDIDPAAALPLAEARPEYIEAVFAEIESRWGGTDAYLAQEAGLEDTARQALRDMLLV